VRRPRENRKAGARGEAEGGVEWTGVGS